MSTGTSSIPVQPGINIRFSSKSSISYLDRIAIKRYKENKHRLISKCKTPTESVLKLSETQNIIEGAESRAAYEEILQPGNASSRSKQNGDSPSPRDSRSSSRGSVSMEIDIKLIDSTEDVDGIESIALPTIHNVSSDDDSERKDGRQTLSSIGKLNIVEFNFFECGSCIKRTPSPTTSQHSPKSGEHSSRGKRVVGSGLDDSNRTHRRRKPLTSNKDTKDSQTELKIGSYSKRVIDYVRQSPSMDVKYANGLGKIHREQELVSPRGVERGMSSGTQNRKAVDRVWKPANTYKEMNIYMAGVSLEGSEENIDINEVPAVNVGNSGQLVTGSFLVGTHCTETDQKVWVPDVSVVYDEAVQNGSRSTSRRNIPPHLAYTGKEESNIHDPDPTFLLPGNVNTDPNTPRVSITSYDFLSAPPPLEKGENWHKLHRASTSLSFSLSPMPVDVWQDSDESSYFDFPTRPGSRRVSANTFHKEHAIAEFNHDLKNKIQEAMGKLEVDVGKVKLTPNDNVAHNEGGGLHYNTNTAVTNVPVVKGGVSCVVEEQDLTIKSDQDFTSPES